MLKTICLLLLGFGVFTLSQVVLPIVAYKIWENSHISQETLLAPIQRGGSNLLGVSVSTTDDNFPAFISSLKRSTKPSFDSFILSVDKINIKDARVVVDSNDLDSSLAHLPGSALPGEKGNVFISGHSSGFLRFNAGGDYKEIFSNLTKLKKGDVIKVSTGQEFKYKVVGMQIVDPKDLLVVLPPDSTGRYISLMTCVPPGINTKRLIVLGKLDEGQ